jgi:hypothetical protein
MFLVTVKLDRQVQMCTLRAIPVFPPAFLANKAIAQESREPH